MGSERVMVARWLAHRIRLARWDCESLAGCLAAFRSKEYRFMVREQDSEQFLREVLSLPPGSREPSPPPPPSSWVGGDPCYRMRKGVEWARADSIQLLRRPEIP